MADRKANSQSNYFDCFEPKIPNEMNVHRTLNHESRNNQREHRDSDN